MSIADYLNHNRNSEYDPAGKNSLDNNWVPVVVVQGVIPTDHDPSDDLGKILVVEPAKVHNAGHPPFRPGQHLTTPGSPSITPGQYAWGEQDGDKVNFTLYLHSREAQHIRDRDAFPFDPIPKSAGTLMFYMSSVVGYKDVTAEPTPGFADLWTESGFRLPDPS